MALRVKSPDVSIEALCALLGKNRQAYYRWRQPDFRQYEMWDILVREVSLLRETYPWVSSAMLYSRFVAIFGKENMPEREVFDRLLKRHGMKAAARRPATEKMSGVLHCLDLTRNCGDCTPGESWQVDVMYVPLRNKGVVYVHLVWDARTQCVLGWKVADSLHGRHSLVALNMAIRQGRERGVDMEALNCHVRRGMQYWHLPYTETLRTVGMRLSQGTARDCGEEGNTEGVGEALKKLFLPREEMAEISDVYFALEKGIPFYNEVKTKNGK